MERKYFDNLDKAIHEWFDNINIGDTVFVAGTSVCKKCYSNRMLGIVVGKYEMGTMIGIVDTMDEIDERTEYRFHALQCHVLEKAK
jgi:hypothetical protein